MTETRYDGRVAIITGAASGMGRAITLRLAAEGAAVLALDIDEAGLAETAADTRAAGRVTTRVTDVSDPEQCRAAVDACVATHGRLDVLGNVAAVAWMAHATDIEPEAWRRMFAVNVEGTFYLCQAAIPHLIETGGNIVNFASNAAFMGMPYLVPYCASKGAVVQLTRALAIEYAKTPMRINAIAPGGTDTPMNTAMELPDAVDFDLIRPGMGYRESGRPEHIAALFAFLAGDEADNIHGAVLNADSGLTTA